MEKNIFKLDNEQLKAIARSFKEKVEKGLNTENAEIQCIPTFITPRKQLSGSTRWFQQIGTGHSSQQWLEERYVDHEIAGVYSRGII